MESEKTFKTKTGFCHILPDKIILTRDGVAGNVSKVAVGNSILRILLIYTALSLFLLYFAFDSYQKGQKGFSVFFALLALYLIYGIINSINNSATPIIERQKIRKVKFKKSIPGFTRSRFEIFFENENGKLKKRLIMLPGSLTEGKNESEKALKLMIDEKIITQR